MAFLPPAWLCQHCLTVPNLFARIAEPVGYPHKKRTSISKMKGASSPQHSHSHTLTITLHLSIAASHRVAPLTTQSAPPSFLPVSFTLLCNNTPQHAHIASTLHLYVTAPHRVALIRCLSLSHKRCMIPLITLLSLSPLSARTNAAHDTHTPHQRIL